MLESWRLSMNLDSVAADVRRLKLRLLQFRVSVCVQDWRSGLPTNPGRADLLVSLDARQRALPRIRGSRREVMVGRFSPRPNHEL
jgi:hypothetical protein